MKHFLFTVFVFCIMLQSTHASDKEAGWTEEELAIIELNRWVPLAPKEAGYAAYAALFHPQYTNWYMGGDRESLRTRVQFLEAVKGWLDAGNYATFSKVEPISVEIFGDMAYVRFVQEEHFHHPEQPPSKFVGHFASMMKKHQGKWTFFRTSFQERFRGPLESEGPSH